jgi:hypothetical protein
VTADQGPDRVLRDWHQRGQWTIRTLRVIHAGKWKVLVFAQHPFRDDIQVTPGPLEFNSDAEALEGALATGHACIDAQPGGG